MFRTCTSYFLSYIFSQQYRASMCWFSGVFISRFPATLAQVIREYLQFSTYRDSFPRLLTIKCTRRRKYARDCIDIDDNIHHVKLGWCTHYLVITANVLKFCVVLKIFVKYEVISLEYRNVGISCAWTSSLTLITYLSRLNTYQNCPMVLVSILQMENIHCHDWFSSSDAKCW